MYIILLSGGSGRRLWPFSGGSRSKQFIKLLKSGDSQYESMLQRIYYQIRKVFPEADILMTTCVDQQEIIENQLGDTVDIIQEPEQRDTFPAVLLSASYLIHERRAALDGSVVIIPVDAYVGDGYFLTIGRMCEAVEQDTCRLMLMGITPLSPSEKYGYIIPAKGDGTYESVSSFREKPSVAEAERLIACGAQWNGGVFACRLSYLAEILDAKLSPNSFSEVCGRYGELEKTSFDYAVVERESSLGMIRYSDQWRDLGTWNSLVEELPGHIIGPGLLAEDAEDTYIINEMDVPVVAVGTRSLIIAAGFNGILVSDLEKSPYIKPYVEQLDAHPVIEERWWGEARTLDTVQSRDGTNSFVRRVIVKSGDATEYHRHSNRDEVWVLLDGTADVVLDGDVREARAGDVLQIPRLRKHALRAGAAVHMIEIQCGVLSEENTECFPWEWN